MVRVYVSSTSYDLKDCREQVCETLRRMRHEDVAMEHYVAEDVHAVVKCLNDVANCDLYICIAAWRYGHVPQGYKHSITELEYRRAVEAGKTCLTFVLAEDADWKMSLVEMGAMDRVKAFREELRRNRISRTFTSPQDLARQVAEAVHEWERQQGIAPAGGRTNWEAYRGAVIAKHHLVPMETLTGPERDRGVQIPLTSVFVAQQASGQAAGNEEAGAELREPSLQVIGRDAKQVIVGEPGSGKSTLLRYTMLAMCGSVIANPVGHRDRPLPFLIELRQYAREKSGGQVQDFIDYLATRAKEFYGPKIEPDELRALLQEDGQALVLFDGLDEILHEGERDKIADQIDAFARQYPRAKIVATSRIAGYNPEPLQGYGFSHYTLRQFGLTEIREFLSLWYANDRGQEPERHAADLSDRIANNPRLRELAGNPLLLTMMAVINRHEELPERRWKLYERCTAVLLEHWDVKRKNIARDEVFPLDFQMTGDQKAQILRRVSMHMLRQPPKREGRLNVIPRKDLMRIVSGYLMATFHKNPGEADFIATEILNHLCERSYILAEIGEDTFGFVHRTFMEYFAAADLLAEFNQSAADYDWLTQDVFGNHWIWEAWQEVLLLLTAMLAAQGSPINRIVDYLLSLRVEMFPRHVVMAARCLGEAGAVDQPWSQSVLDRLGDGIMAWAAATGNAERILEAAARFVDQALGVFSTLALAVRPTPSLIAKIDEFEAKSSRHHIVAWQMKLALRPKEERLSFAIQALRNSADSVRIGAVNALEREWPGRDDVGPHLLRVLRTDRSARVRQAAIQALTRSWPEQAGILEAVAARAGNETSAEHVDWLVRYLATEWRHDHAALEVVLKLAAVRPRPSTVEVSLIVGEAAAEAIVLGWCDQPGLAAWLRDRHVSETDQQVRDAIVIAIARCVWNEEWALAWLQPHAVHSAKKGIRSIVLRGIKRVWGEDLQVRAWLGSRSVDDPDVEVRLLALGLVGGNDISQLKYRLESPIREGPGDGWWPWYVATQWRGHSESISLLEERAVNDASPVIRRAALGGVYAYRSSSATAFDFLYSRLAQEPDRDTRAMNLLILTEGASEGTTLPRGLAVTLGFVGPGFHQIGRPFSGIARPHTPEHDRLRAALTGVAENDEYEKLRAAAAQAVAALWGDRPEVSEWLDERIRKDPSKDARALLKSFRTR